jgi:site-specific recombinase XerD
MELGAGDWKRILSIWRSSGRTVATVERYGYWARRYVEACVSRGARIEDSLTEPQVRRFFVNRVEARDTTPVAAVRALWCALRAMGHCLPPWREARREPFRPPVVQEFIAHRLRHRGIAIGTARGDAHLASAFLQFLRSRQRRVAAACVADVDDFVAECARKWAPKSVAAACSTLRAFLSFLFATGRCRTDLASMVAPRPRRLDRPPRALPWADVRRILRAIDVDAGAGLGCRDFAMFLMMATYGMGAGEITSLTIDDIDWVARTVRVRRPKTGAWTVLPLLDPVARALARYLLKSRPAHACDRSVFVSHQMPHSRLSGAAPIHHRLAKYARLAGVRADFLGTHLFRHAHATRQIEAGAHAKIVGDILGHQRPESTSAYVRSALATLRTVALPVPR